MGFKIGQTTGRFFLAVAVGHKNHGFITAKAPSLRGPRAVIRTLQVGPLTIATVLPR